jgi:hypothetical protein
MTRSSIIFIVAIMLLFLSREAHAQTANLSAATTAVTCPTNGTGTGCITVITTGSGSIGIQVEGTWSGTLTGYASVGGVVFETQGFFGGNTTTTSNGLWTTSIAGFQLVQIAFTAYTSGTAVVSIRVAPAGGGGGGGSVLGTVTANAGTNLNTSLLATSANQTNATQKTQVVDGSGNVIASTSNALNIDCVAGCSGSNANGQATMANSAPVVIASNQSAIPVTGTFYQTTQPVSGTFFQTTQPVSAASLPLPTGAATSALQSTANTSLATLVTNSPALGQALATASIPVILPAATITTLTPPTSVTVTQATGTNLHTVVDSAPTTAVTESGTWTVQPGNSANSTPWLVTAGQATAASLNATVVHPSADPCQGHVKSYLSINQTTTTQLLAASGSGISYWICSVNIVSATAQNVAIIDSATAGNACATSPAGSSGFGGSTAATGWNFAANGGIAYGNGGATIGSTSTTNRALCIAQSGSGQLSGGISYVSQ